MIRYRIREISPIIYVVDIHTVNWHIYNSYSNISDAREAIERYKISNDITLGNVVEES